SKMSGTPSLPCVQRTPSNLFAIGCAKRWETERWSAASTLMAKFGACRKRFRFGERSDRLHSTSAGDRETELNELHVRPIGVPSGATVVTIATPVGNVPSAFLKSRGSNAEPPLSPPRAGGSLTASECPEPHP